MTRNMAASVIEHERIITTLPKAKAVKPFIEKLVTLAKDPSQHNRRRAFSKLRNKEATTKLFDVLGPRFLERPGGYLSLIHISEPTRRRGISYAVFCLKKKRSNYCSTF